MAEDPVIEPAESSTPEVPPYLSSSPPPPSPVRVTREAHLRAWVGRREHLDRLVLMMQESLAKVYERSVKALPDEPYEREAATERLLRALTVSTDIEARSGNIERTGTMDAILAEVDFRDVRTVTIRNSGRDYFNADLPTIKIEMTAETQKNWSAKLVVTGQDRQWVGGMFDMLSAELKNRVPWWTWLRLGRASAIVGALATVGAFLYFYANSPADARGDASIYVPFAMACVCIGGVASMLAINPLLRLLIPGFEILQPGDTARGRQAVTITVGTISFALAVLGLIVSL